MTVLRTIALERSVLMVRGEVRSELRMDLGSFISVESVVMHVSLHSNFVDVFSSN
jgi:hypothetical protein